MEQLHAILAPSSAHEWVECTFSVVGQRPFPDEETDEAKEGTASHWVGSSVLEAYKTTDEAAQINPLSYIGTQAPNGVIINESMAEGALEYVNDVLVMMQAHAMLKVLMVEQRVYAPRINKHCWGTPDAFAYDEKTGTLYIWDYKYGHRYVSVFENWQLICYAAAILDTLLSIDGRTEQYITIVFRIVQPRCYQAEGIVREWKINAGDLRGYVNRLQSAADEALSNNPKVKTGPHCRDCRARFACKGAQTAAMNALEYSGEGAANLSILPPDALGVELQMLERGSQIIKDRYDALKAQAEGLVLAGHNVPGWGGSSTYGHRKWSKPTAEVLSIGKLLGHDLKKPDQPITPNQALKLGIDESVINAYSDKPKTGFKLIRDDGSKARHVFSQPRGLFKNE